MWALRIEVRANPKVRVKPNVHCQIEVQRSALASKVYIFLTLALELAFVQLFQSPLATFRLHKTQKQRSSPAFPQYTTYNFLGSGSLTLSPAGERLASAAERHLVLFLRILQGLLVAIDVTLLAQGNTRVCTSSGTPETILF